MYLSMRLLLSLAKVYLFIIYFYIVFIFKNAAKFCIQVRILISKSNNDIDILSINCIDSICDYSKNKINKC